MGPAQEILAVARTERRRALLAGALVVATVGILHALVAGARGLTLSIWAAWVGLLLAGALLVRFGPPWLPAALGLVTSLTSVAALHALALHSGGSASPFFLVLPFIPLLMVLVVPDDAVDAGLASLFVVLGGGALLVREGRPTADVALWATMSGTAFGFALAAALRHRRRQVRAVEQELERATVVEQLARSERARAEAERWASVGMLADGVAHDINSPLASLRSNLLFLRDELAASGADRELSEALADALLATDRIRETVSGLQAFSRADSEAREREALAAKPEVTPAPLPITPRG
jgi:signal transduction histidine kinase